MKRDVRYESIKVMIETGHIVEFAQIFNFLPKTILSKELRTNNNRMTRLIGHPEQLSVEEILKISELIGVDVNKVFSIILRQYFSAKKSGRQ